MQTNNNSENYNNITQMLFQLALGDLEFRILPEVNPLENKLNRFADELQTRNKTNSNTETYCTINGLVTNILIVDKNHNIKAFTQSLPTLLGYTKSQLLTTNLNQILTPKAIKNITSIKKNTLAQCLFQTANKQLIPLSCSMLKVSGTNEIAITTIAIDWKTRLVVTNAPPEYGKAPTNEDKAIILQQYILENLNKPLPNIKQLCRIIGTNDFALKDGFKKQFKTSIYQFYNEERLKRAHLLILQTSLPLKDVAFHSGFTNYSNFYKAFRKKYTYTPTHLVRKMQQ